MSPGPHLDRPLRTTTRTLAAGALLLAGAFGLATGLTGCARTGSNGTPKGADRLIVFAASSLTDAMRQIADSYRQAKGVDIQVSFGASGMLARQIANGAPADVFLSANTAWVDWLAERSLCESGTRKVILRNSLVVIAPAGSAHELTRLNGLAGMSRVALANTTIAPAGIYAKQALRACGAWAVLQGKIVEAETARGTLALVQRGEADAGIVYATDAQAGDRIEVILAVPAELHDPVEFAAVAIRSQRDAEAKGRFMRHLQSNEALAVFEKLGFEVSR